MTVKTPLWLSSQESPGVLGAPCQERDKTESLFLTVNHNITGIYPEWNCWVCGNSVFSFSTGLIPFFLSTSVSSGCITNTTEQVLKQQACFLRFWKLGLQDQGRFWGGLSPRADSAVSLWCLFLFRKCESNAAWATFHWIHRLSTFCRLSAVCLPKCLLIHLLIYWLIYPSICGSLC